MIAISIVYLIYQSQTHELIEVKEGPDGQLDPATLVRHDARDFGVQNPQGMTVDPVTGDLFILDSAVPGLVRVEPASDGAFREAEVTAVGLQPVDIGDPRGLAFDPTTGHLHLLSPSEEKLYEVTRTGATVATRSLLQSDCGLRNPQGMVFAPSGDLTDDPARMSLYAANTCLAGQDVRKSGQNSSDSPGDGAEDSFETMLYLPLVTDGSGRKNDLAESALSAVTQGSGQILELTLVAPAAQLVQVVSSSTAALIQTIDTSQLDPPSPDSAGITYLPLSNRLLMSDSEVNEMPIYEGANLFELSLTGNLHYTSTTLSFVTNLENREPTGVVIMPDPDPAKERLFVSDDDKKEIYVVAAGPDGHYGTSDDAVSHFDTKVFDSEDPEGVTFDTLQGVLFIADGVNAEVYRVAPGPNGLFDGVGVDDVVTHFDTESLGVRDPEGIAFDPDSGHLFIVGKTVSGPPAYSLLQITTAGVLLQTFNIEAANYDKPAGMVYAPSSINPAVKSMYIVDRGVDNNSDPDENDGKLYEMSLTGVVPSNDPPTAVDDPDSITPEDTTVTVDVAANDSDPDGNLDPTSANTDLCHRCAGPANGRSGQQRGRHLRLHAHLNFNGTDSFVYEICDTGSLCDTATVSITVTAVNDPPLAVDDSGSARRRTQR